LLGGAGPQSFSLLAKDVGEVLNLDPLAGDWRRVIGKQHRQQGAHSVPFNRGKKSIALDLKKPEGLAIARKLASEADVILENYRPGVMARFGLDYPSVTKDNPSVVYLSITGFGQEGPNANLPATDSVMQAYSGLMSVTRDSDGMPMRVGLLAIDISTGLYAFQAVAPALYRKAMTGKGKHITTSLMEAIGAFQAAKMVEYQLEGDEVLPSGVPVGTFECKDGYININGRRDAHFVSFCRIIGRPDLAEDPKYATVPGRFEHEAELMAMLREGAKKMTVAELHAALNESGVLNAPVHSYGDYFNDPHVKEVNAVQWIDHAEVGRVPFPNIPGHPPARQEDPLTHSPYIGEHSREVLKGIGYDDAAIDALGASGAVGIWEQAQAAD